MRTAGGKFSKPAAAGRVAAPLLRSTPASSLVPSRSHRATPTAAAAFPSTKVLHLLRHGPTEMAAYMALHKYGSPHQEPLRDPMMYDTVLTKAGAQKAAELAPRVAALHPRPEVVLVSPLTRCLQTATLACEDLLASGAPVRLEVEPLLRERLVLSSEVGRPPSHLREDFPEVAFPPDMPDVWWYQPPRRPGEPHADPRVVVQEPQGEYLERLGALRRTLAARREGVLLLVSHWGVLNALAGVDLQPAELATAAVEL